MCHLMAGGRRVCWLNPVKLQGKKNSSASLVSCTNFSHLRSKFWFSMLVFWLGLFFVVFFGFLFFVFGGFFLVWIFANLLFGVGFGGGGRVGLDFLLLE